MGNIGKPLRRIELEPLSEPAPQETPSPVEPAREDPSPVEPAVPAEPEQVPA